MTPLFSTVPRDHVNVTSRRHLGQQLYPAATATLRKNVTW